MAHRSRTTIFGDEVMAAMGGTLNGSRGEEFENIWDMNMYNSSTRPDWEIQKYLEMLWYLFFFSKPAAEG